VFTIRILTSQDSGYTEPKPIYPKLIGPSYALFLIDTDLLVSNNQLFFN